MRRVPVRFAEGGSHGGAEAANAKPRRSLTPHLPARVGGFLSFTDGYSWQRESAKGGSGSHLYKTLHCLLYLRS